MTRADGDDRPIRQVRADIMTVLILRPADHGLPEVTVQLSITAALDGLAGTSTRDGDVNGFPITPPTCASYCAGWCARADHFAATTG